MNFFDHKDLGNHLLKLCPKVVNHPVYTYTHIHTHTHTYVSTTQCYKVNDDKLDFHFCDFFKPWYYLSLIIDL